MGKNKGKKLSPSEVAEEILAMVDLKAKKGKKGEDPVAFATRVVKAADGLDEKDFDGLSEQAQEYLNAQLASMNDGEDPEALPGTDAETLPGTDAETEDEKPAKKGKAEKPAGRKGNSALKTFTTLVVKNRGQNVAQVMELLSKNGLSVLPSTASVTYYKTHQLLSILDELGMLKAPPKGE